MPDCKKCLPLYLIRINFKNTHRVSLKGHDFILKVTLILCSFYFVIMACDECHFTREETILRGSELASATGGQGRSGVRPPGWITLLHLALGQLHLRLAKVGAEYVF